MPGVGHFGQAVAEPRRRPGSGAAVREAAARGPGRSWASAWACSSSSPRAPRRPRRAGSASCPGEVRRFDTALPVPHVGWARVEPDRRRSAGIRCWRAVFHGAPQFFYHVHSYHPAGAARGATCWPPARTSDVFPTIVGRGNVLGAQFHPEKSQRAGIELLDAFAAVAAVTSVRVSLVDLYVLRGAGSALECLVLRRAAGGRCPGLVGDGARPHRAGRDAGRRGPARAARRRPGSRPSGCTT